MRGRWLTVTLLSVSLTGAVARAQESPAAPTTAESDARTQPAGSDTDRLRAEQRAYFGRNVRVHLTDGTTTTGRLIGETAEGLAVQPSPSDEPVLIPYEKIESIAVGMRRWQKIAIGLGAAGAALLAVALN